MSPHINNATHIRTQIHIELSVDRSECEWSPKHKTNTFSCLASYKAAVIVYFRSLTLLLVAPLSRAHNWTSFTQKKDVVNLSALMEDEFHPAYGKCTFYVISSISADKSTTSFFCMCRQIFTVLCWRDRMQMEFFLFLYEPITAIMENVGHMLGIAERLLLFRLECSFRFILLVFRMKTGHPVVLCVKL